MDKSTHGSEPIRNEKTGITSGLILEATMSLCRKCIQYTNHIDGDCQKCAEKLRREAMSPDDELIEYLRSDEHRTAIAIEVLREKLEEVEAIEEAPKSIDILKHRKIAALEKSIELLTKK